RRRCAAPRAGAVPGVPPGRALGPARGSPGLAHARADADQGALVLSEEAAPARPGDQPAAPADAGRGDPGVAGGSEPIMKRCLMYSQHVLGVGHFVRTLNIASGLTGMEVRLVNGGETSPGLAAGAGVEIVNLPALRSDENFTTLRSADDGG